MNLPPDSEAHNAAVDAVKRSVFEMTDFTIDHTPFEENVSFLIFNDSSDGWGASVRLIAVADTRANVAIPAAKLTSSTGTVETLMRIDRKAHQRRKYSYAQSTGSVPVL